MARIQTDIILFGGGIAGLWALNRLLQSGYSAVLLESAGLGGVQTLSSQGIIHGGTKYALSGAFSDSAKAIGAMPGRWRACLSGHGELDLSAVRISAEHQYLWSTEGLASKLAGFFAGKLMQSRMCALDAAEAPALFQTQDFKGRLYRLDEPVLDIPSLIEVLSVKARHRCFQLAEQAWEPLPGGKGIRLRDGSELHCQSILLCAGAGNEALLRRFARSTPVMQLRPLHMLMARGRLPLLYGHCLGASANPRLTITSHRDGEGRVVWYMGGQPAESGVTRGFEEQIEAGRRELEVVLPWVDFTAVQWSSFRVDRAEPEQPGGKRPDSSFLDAAEGLITLWPTKLAFAPLLADRLLTTLEGQGIAPRGSDTAHIPLPPAALAAPPWERAQRWI